MRKNYFATGLGWIWISILVIATDRFTKIWAQQYLEFAIPKPIIPSFNLTLSYNRGSAFGFLNAPTGWQSWLFGAIAIGVSVALIIWLAKLSFKQKWLTIALCLVLGGALGNLWDRFLYGHVVDFIQLYASNFYWPIFNIADSAICIGAVMLFFDALFGHKKS